MRRIVGNQAQIYLPQHSRGFGMIKVSNNAANRRNNQSKGVVDDPEKKGDRATQNGPERAIWCKPGHTFTIFPQMGFFCVFNGAPGQI